MLNIVEGNPPEDLKISFLIEDLDYLTLPEMYQALDDGEKNPDSYATVERFNNLPEAILSRAILIKGISRNEEEVWDKELLIESFLEDLDFSSYETLEGCIKSQDRAYRDYSPLKFRRIWYHTLTKFLNSKFSHLSEENKWLVIRLVSQEYSNLFATLYAPRGRTPYETGVINFFLLFKVMEV